MNCFSLIIFLVVKSSCTDFSGADSSLTLRTLGIHGGLSSGYWVNFVDISLKQEVILATVIPRFQVVAN